MNERDTQFVGFAKLLLADLDGKLALRSDIVLPELETLIAQHAYDLVRNICETIGLEESTGRLTVDTLSKEYVERWYRLSRDRSLAVHRDGSATLYLDPDFTQIIRFTPDEVQRLQEALIEKTDIMPVSKGQA